MEVCVASRSLVLVILVILKLFHEIFKSNHNIPFDSIFLYFCLFCEPTSRSFSNFDLTIEIFLVLNFFWINNYTKNIGTTISNHIGC